MAQQGDQLYREKLCCSICVDLLNNPVFIPCGHSYCMKCVECHWNKEDQNKIYSCPQCRKTFRSRPALLKNIMLADLVEELKKTEHKAATADPCYAGPEDVACDLCNGRKRKASKSCQQCLVSYCEQHLQPHYEVVPLKKHKLVEASAKFQQNICFRHNQVKTIFCCTDRQIVCYICAMEQHKGHDTVLAEAEIPKRQEKIRLSRHKIQHRIQGREKDVKLLQQEFEAIDRSAEEVLRNSEEMSNELIQLISTKKINVKNKIKSQHRNEMTRAKKLQDKLKQEIIELRKKDTELERLLLRENQTELLCKDPSLSCPSESTYSPSILVRPVRHFEDVTTALSEAKGKLQGSCRKEWKKILKTVTEVDVLLPQDLETREELSQYAVDKNALKLDPNSAHLRMVLSKENRKVTWKKDQQSFSSSSSRFMDKSQVLCAQMLTGRCYFEVQWSGMSVSIAVAYKDIAKTGEESLFGNNDKSWVLECSSKGYTFKHSSDPKNIPGPLSSKIGVFLDHKAGILSFYSVSETIEQLHKVQNTFTQPLFAGLGVYYNGSSAEFCDIS